MSTNKRLDIKVKAAKNVSAAPTNAARIGVLKQRRTSRQHRGFFYVRHHGITPYGRSVRGLARGAGSFARYANLHGIAHPDWRRGERFASTAAKEATMVIFARRARRAHSPRTYHAAPVVCPATRPKPAVANVLRDRPRQCIKCVWGLRGAESNHGLTVIVEDSTLMDMDAPTVLPAGSHRSYQPCPDQFPDWYSIRETTVLRDGFQFV